MNNAVKTSLIGFGLFSMACFADMEFSGEVAAEYRFYPQQALYPQQDDHQPSVYIEPEFYWQWNNGDDSLLFVPFLRYDAMDSERTHGDIRELLWWHVEQDWDLRAGIGKVFWGQTESIHLVDVINQTDGVEAIDGEDKLGQPMISVSLFRDWGTTAFFLLPYFRERTFPGADGRLRPEWIIEQDDPLYESGAEQSHVDWAVRWNHSIDRFDLGLSYFDGTAREPDLLPMISEQNGEVRLFPYYYQMQQVGIDALMTYGDWLWKLEAIYRNTTEQDYAALVGGFEYTQVGVFDSIYDIGWLMEYQWDDRDGALVPVGQSDLMVGSRLVFNDFQGTEILLGYVQDLDTSSSRSGFVEASSRINDHWKWRFEAYLFSSDQPDDSLYLIRRDDHLQFSLEYYF